ncbi:MAG: hypothetical protein FJX68_14745 [Alphaproteobacteria bacterium]|nr:hypothetical protein [Alphaproteobacteria bacterium]
MLRLLFIVPALAACQATAPQPSFPEFRYTHLPRIGLDVSRIEVRQNYQAPLRAPNVDHLFPVAPANAAVRWADDRLAAMGSAGTAVFVIEDASATAERLPLTGGLRGAFTREQADRVTVSLRARLDVETAGGLARGSAAAFATRSQTLAEDITLNERDRAHYLLTEQAMGDLNAQLEANIRQHLLSFLR